MRPFEEDTSLRPAASCLIFDFEQPTDYIAVVWRRSYVFTFDCQLLSRNKTRKLSVEPYVLLSLIPCFLAARFPLNVIV